MGVVEKRVRSRISLGMKSSGVTGVVRRSGSKTQAAEDNGKDLSNHSSGSLLLDAALIPTKR